MLQIHDPYHGAVLNHRHGRVVDGGLAIEVRGQCGIYDRVTVNGQKAEQWGPAFTQRVVLREQETDIRVVADGPSGSQSQVIRVVYDRNSQRRYRFSIDDNVYLLRDIAEHGYRSIFDCFYLRNLRELNRTFGTKFVLNIYFSDGGVFELPKFPDRYRGEWRDNGDWLKLAFHGRADAPDRPYQEAQADEVARDFDDVASEILRFAGPEAYCPPSGIHWAMLPEDCLPVLTARGVTALSGFFWRRGDHFDINYCLDAERTEYLSRHEALKDFRSGIVFSRIDLCCNLTPPDATVAELEKAAGPETGEIMDVFTHEQYFWPFYPRYLPDHLERLQVAVRWLTEHDYAPVFFHEGFLGNPDS